MKDVTVLGSYSGRNAGDAAILGNLIHDISSERPDVRFLIPTLSPKFINECFGDYNVKAMGLMPWNLAIKILGLPTLLSMIKTDMVLITDNALFDRKYYNPLVNFLFTIGLIAPLCKKRGIPIVFYNANVGPIFTKAGNRALQKVLDTSPLVILRDPESEELLQSLNLTYPDAILKKVFYTLYLPDLVYIAYFLYREYVDTPSLLLSFHEGLTRVFYPKMYFLLYHLH